MQNNFEFEDDDNSTISDVVSVIPKTNNALEQYKKNGKTNKEQDFEAMVSKKFHNDHYRMTLRYRSKINGGKPFRFEYYVTKNITGYPIYNALTGTFYLNYTVGSMYENLFFKVQLTNEDSYKSQTIMSQNKKKSKVIAISTQKEDPEILFYDSPEEYESHYGTELPHNLKNNWRIRYERLCAYLAKKEQERSERFLQQQNKFYQTNVENVETIEVK